MPHPMSRRSVCLVVVTLVTALGAVGLAACGGGGSADPAPGRESAEEALASGATVIDVRTPAEYSERRVEGAALLDFQSPDFAERVEGLDPDTEYVVYCRSGNRSARAAEVMRNAGLTVLDGGGLEDMAAAGWPTQS